MGKAAHFFFLRSSGVKFVPVNPQHHLHVMPRQSRGAESPKLGNHLLHIPTILQAHASRNWL